MAELSISRRRFLKATGWTAVGVTLIYTGGRRVLSQLPSFDVPGDEAGAAWLQIRADGRCRMLCPRAEMGQNASIGLAQIAAEELNIAVEDIDLRFPNTHEIPQVILTAGSMSLKFFAEPTARAAAALREIMRGRAAEHAGVDLTTVEDGVGGFVLAGWPHPGLRRSGGGRTGRPGRGECFRRHPSTASMPGAHIGRSVAAPRRTSWSRS